MILSYCTYALLLALVLWGGKFAGCKNHFHDDYTSLETTKSLRGLAALGVLVHHLAQEEPFRQTGELSLLPNIGYLFVGIFFFCSGYGLIKSMQTKPDYFKTFFKKRLLTLVIPFYVMNAFYAVFRIIIGPKMGAIQWICSFVGLTMLNGSSWFVIVLSILYVAFYFIFKNEKNRKTSFVLIALLVFAMGAVFCVGGHFAWWAGEPNWWLSDFGWSNAKWWMHQYTLLFNGEWWVNSPIAFLAGLMFATYEVRITEWAKKRYVLKLIVLLALTAGAHILTNFCQRMFGFWSEWNGTGPGIGNKAVCLLSQMPHVLLFVCSMFMILLKYRAINPISKWLGNYSLETYLMQYMPLEAFRFLIYRRYGSILVKEPFHYNLALYAVAVLSATFALAVLFKFVHKAVYKRIAA